MSAGLEPTITLTHEDDWWVAKDTETGVASQGETREEALENLDEAVSLHEGEIGKPVADEAELLRTLGIDPDDGETELPDFLR